jgi:hypothetical protein
LVAVVPIIVPIAVMVAVPAMVVGDSASITIPIALKVAGSIVVRFHPVGAGVHGPCPVAAVPLIAVVHGEPISIDPRVADAGTARLNSDYARPRRRSDPHSDGNLSE